MQHYIQRNETVNPVTADLLDGVFAQASRSGHDDHVPAPGGTKANDRRGNSRRAVERGLTTVV